MDTFKGIINDAGDLFDTLKDKIANPTAEDTDGQPHKVEDAIRKITFTEMSDSVASSTGSRGDIPQQMVVDVLIVGAGLAGLTTAYRLLQNDRSLKITIIEASDRVGGRLMTRSIKTAGAGRDFFDIGSEWLCRRQKHILNLVEELGLETFDQDYAGKSVLVPHEGAPIPYEECTYPIGILGRYDLNSFIARLEVLRQLVPLDDPTRCEDALMWDATTLEEFKRSHTWIDGSRQVFDALVVLSIGVTPREVSLLFFLYLLNTYNGWHNMCNIGRYTAREKKIKGGAERLCAMLADRLGRDKIILSDAVVEVNQDDDERCSVRTEEGRIFWARRVVVTIPPKCIRQIDFRPRLPLGKETINKHSFSGTCLKYVITFETVFWRNDVIGKNGVAIQLVDQRKELERLKVHGEADIMGYSYVFDATTVNSMPALMGVAYSRKLRDAYEPSEREDVILKSLKEIFGDGVYSRIDYTDKIWGDEPHESDLPCCVISPGVFALNHMMIQRPFMRVHWAGTETATSWYGQMEGAVESADRVAKEVTRALNQQEGEDLAVYTDAEEVRERSASLGPVDDETTSL